MSDEFNSLDRATEDNRSSIRDRIRSKAISSLNEIQPNNKTVKSHSQNQQSQDLNDSQESLVRSDEDTFKTNDGQVNESNNFESFSSPTDKHLEPFSYSYSETSQPTVKKSSKWWIWFIGIAVILCVALFLIPRINSTSLNSNPGNITGIAENNDSTESNSSIDSSNSENSTQISDLPSAYQNILTDPNKNFLYTPGFTLLDLDDNGTDELVIGSVDDPTLVMGVYTLNNDEAIELATIPYPDVWIGINENNQILYTQGEGINATSIYTLDGTEIVLDEVYSCDYSNNYFKSNDMENLEQESITESEYNENIKGISLNLTPLEV